MKSNKPSKKMLQRIFIVLICTVIIMFSVSSVSLSVIMLGKGEHLQGMASEQQLYDSLITAPRGKILDRNNKVLAESTTAWTVYVTPNGILKLSSEKQENVRNAIADGLSPIIGVERDTIYENTGKNSYYVILKKKIDKVTADKVREFLTENKDLGLTKYIGLDETTQRYYPNNNMASVVLGFVGDDNQGLSGIEAYYDTELTGVAGRVVAAKTAHGIDMPFTYEMVEEAQEGNTLVLTLDNYIQSVAEKYLKQAVEINKCTERGVAIVMNVNTGEIFAMAVSGDFNPNSPFTLSSADQAIVDGLTGQERTDKVSELLNRQWRNKAISDTYEPGSVFKIVTASAALEENAATLNSRYTCIGYTQIAGQGYYCHKHSGHGTQTLVQATSNSCNPAFITMGQTLGKNVFSKYFDAFGLTEKAGIDLPGETNSLYYPAERMGPVELASASFGQSFKVTPIQLISATAASVNGGYLVKPHIVSKIVDSEGRIVKTADTDYRRQVISTQTSEQMRTVLEAVVKGGAKNGYVAGYRTGGKTGTSEKLDKAKGLYVASYVGIAPIDNPEIAVLVLLDEPHGNSIYGGTISAPVAASIFEEILPYLGYEPHYTDEELSKRAISVPSVTGISVADAKGRITTSNLVYRVVGSGDTVISQLPEAGNTLYSGGMVILYTEQGDTDEKLTVVAPDFSGKTAAEVNALAADAGVNIEFSGNTLSSANTLAYRQSVSAGSIIEQGTIITVYFRDSSVADFAVGQGEN